MFRQSQIPKPCNSCTWAEVSWQTSWRNTPHISANLCDPSRKEENVLGVNIVFLNAMQTIGKWNQEDKSNNSTFFRAQHQYACFNILWRFNARYIFKYTQTAYITPLWTCASEIPTRKHWFKVTFSTNDTLIMYGKTMYLKGSLCLQGERRLIALV